MILDCTGESFIYRWPAGEVHFEPGKPIDMPDERAQRVLSKAPGRVRVIAPTFELGSTISWRRGDGTAQTGKIAWILREENGNQWAFVSSLTDETWAAINGKFVKRVDP